MSIRMPDMTHVSFASIAYGDAGIEQTLNLMRELIDTAIDSPRVVHLARALAVQTGERRQYAQAVVIREWLKRVWRFVYDPADRELLMDVDEALNALARLGVIPGDCDEAAIVGASLGRAIGLYARLIVYAFETDDDPAQTTYHVFAVLLTDDGREVNLDVTRPRGPVPAPTRSFAVDV